MSQEQNKELRRFADLMLESYDKTIEEKLNETENDMSIDDVIQICSKNFLRTYIDTGSFSPLFETKGFGKRLDNEFQEVDTKSYELFLNSLSNEELTRLLETLLLTTQDLKWRIKHAIQKHKDEIEYLVSEYNDWLTTEAK